MKWFTLAVVFLVTAASALSQDQDDSKLLEGTWLVEKAEVGGAAFPEDLQRKMSLTIKGGRYLVEVAGQKDAGTIQVAAKQKTKTMDIKGDEGLNKDKTYLTL